MNSSVLTGPEPSLELKGLLKQLANKGSDFMDIFGQVCRVGLEEGFSEKEIKGLVTVALRDVYNRSQIYYLFHKVETKEKNAKAYENRKALINQNMTQKNDTYTDTKKSKIIDVAPLPESPYRKAMNDVEKLKNEKQVLMNQAALNTMAALMKSGFDPDKGVNIIKGDMDKIQSELNEYRDSTKRALVIFQKLD